MTTGTAVGVGVGATTASSADPGPLFGEPAPDEPLPDEPDDEERGLCGQLYRRAPEFVRGEFEPRTWQMFWRSVIDGLPTAAVAAELGTSPAAVRQARSRILRRFREEVEELNLELSG